MLTLPRTYLFVPGDRPERFAKAAASGADAVVLDLEDAVTGPAKAQARLSVGQALLARASRAAAPTAASVAATGAEPTWVVRINDGASPQFESDCELLAQADAALARSGCDWAVMLPKAEETETLARVRRAAPSAALLPLVETARGVQAAAALAAAPGVQRLVFGTLDYALDLGLEGEAADTLGLDTPAALLAIASRAAGIATPVAGVTAALDDEPRLRADFARMRAFGFGAKLCIHPRQVAPVHAALQPTEAEIAWAQRVIALVDGAPASPASPGAPVDVRPAGALQIDGRMVDRPVIERARRLLARARP